MSNARRSTLRWTLLLLCAATSAGLAAPGDLDPTFGNAGVTATTIRSRRRADANDVIRQPDGKFIVAGVTETTGGTLETVAVVARYDAAGQLDPTFGAGGVVEIGDPGGGVMAWRAALQSDGKILVAVSFVGLVRLHPDGTRDLGFLGPVGDVGALAVLPDDRIYALRRTGILTRLLPDGTSDVTFNGMFSGVVLPVSGAYGMSVQADGKILVAGGVPIATGRVVRVRDDGTLDGGFGTGGVASVPDTSFVDVAVQSDGKIVAVGVGLPEGQLVARFDSAGSLDPTFGAGGTVVQPTFEPALAVRAQANGKIVVVGGFPIGSAAFPEQRWQLVRYTASGALDGSFGSGGVTIAAFSPLGTFPGAPFFSDTGAAAGLLLEPDGRIVAVGQLGGTASQMLITRYQGDCGDGVLDPNEACDDGNLSSGDCCSRQCGFDPAGTRCAGSGDLCTNDVCDAGGACLAGAVGPASGCLQGTQPGSSSLLLKDASAPSGDLVTWEWRKGNTIPAAALGDPVTTTDYALCVYEESGPTQLTKLDAPAGGLCGSSAAPCWKALGNPPGSKGYRYHDGLRASDGLDKLTLKPGIAPRPQVALTGKGPSLTLPGLPIAGPFAIRAQLKNSIGLCLEARYTVPQANSSQVFRAMSE